MLHGVNFVHTGRHRIVSQQVSKDVFFDLVHASCIGICAATEATVTQVHSIHTVMVADFLHHGIIPIQRCIIKGGQHYHKLAGGIRILQTKDCFCIRIGKGIPLGSRPICTRIRCIKDSQLGAVEDIIGTAVEDDHIRGTVAAQILNTGLGSHGSFFDYSAGILIQSIAYQRTRPAVIDTQLCTQLGNQLMPPHLSHSKICSGVLGRMLHVEAVCCGDGTCICRNIVTQNRNDFSIIVRQIGLIGRFCCINSQCSLLGHTSQGI